MIPEIEKSCSRLDVKVDGAMQLFQDIEAQRAGTHLPGREGAVDFSHLCKPIVSKNQRYFVNAVWTIVSMSLRTRPRSENLKLLLATYYSHDGKTHSGEELRSTEYDLLGNDGTFDNTVLANLYVKDDLRDAKQTIIRRCIADPAVKSRWDELRRVVGFRPMQAVAYA